MAWTFADQIHSLSGYDADSTSDTETGEDFNILANQWLTDAAKEVINVLPRNLKMKCAKMTSLTDATPMDLDSFGQILHVTRENADSGYQIGCREVDPIYGASTEDSTSLYKASATDPAYWIESDTGGDPKLFVRPNPTASQPARVHAVSYPPNSPVWDGSNLPGEATSISNFPDEAEYLVVIRAAITAAQYLLATEEDPELYIPVISSLKAQYQEGIQGLITGTVAMPQEGAK